MKRAQLENYFSAERLNRYFAEYPDNESKAICLYECNIAISEALYTPLSILEVALRNRINAELVRKYGRQDWYAEWYKDPVTRYAWPEINNTIRHLHEDKKEITPDKVIAGLMFGFWTSLFNDRYEKELWGNLRFVFPEMPKAIKQRKNISKPLNDIRRALRNRVYHNEPIIFSKSVLISHYLNITKLLGWMGADLHAYNYSRDRFPATLNEMGLRMSFIIEEAGRTDESEKIWYNLTGKG
jgi:hypothetical protein